jgi:L-amino acid N-acyltransferase YncA
MTRDDGLTFGLATDADWAGIWPIFREVVSGGDTYMYPPEIDEASARALWMSDAPTRRVTYVARLGGAIVGSAFVRPNAPGLGDHLANAAWMVSSACRGRGVGRRFAEWVIDDARRQGYKAMQFNAVVASNARAVALWRSLGFEILGEVPGAFRHRTLGLTAVYIMYRAL